MIENDIPSAADQPPIVQEAIERVIALEQSNVGCGPVCSCRARFAVYLSPAQLSQLFAHAKRVEAGEITSDEATVKALFPDLHPGLSWILDKIARDRGSKTHDEIKGGRDNALQSLLNYFEFEQLKAQIGNIGIVIEL